jgi:thiol-disulfide isomerase/thioredoxin
MKISRGMIWFLLGGFIIGAVIGFMVLWNRHPEFRLQDVTGSITGTVKNIKTLPFSDFELNTLDGQQIKLSDFKGRPVLVNFWATWCDPCKEEMPLFEQVYSTNNVNLMVIGVNAQEDPAIVKPFVEQYRLTFPIAMDRNGDVEKLYAVRGYPTTFFIDANGVLQAQHIGQLNDNLLKNYLKLIGVE